jgi:putative flippase GtrA
VSRTEKAGPQAKDGQFTGELSRFGVIGGLGWVVDTLTFNLFLNVLGLASVRSGILANTVAIGANYLGHRHWTYRQRDKGSRKREIVLFVLFSVIGMAIQNGFLAVSHYGFGYTSAWADTVAKNVVGLSVATAFRFWAYRNWVFCADHRQPADVSAHHDMLDTSGQPSMQHTP